ncbi:SusD/RagB family nutrient-binding outer membrane lipoprotein [Spirosoma lituiforme]
MKQIKILTYSLLAATLLSLTACRDEFATINTNPDAVLSVPPEYEFTAATLAIHNNSFEYYYDYNRAIYYWTQSFVTRSGNGQNVYEGSGNLNQRFNNFYNSVGNRLVDVQQLIDRLPADQKARYVQLRAIAGIPLAYYAWYTSDVNGSIPYTEAFKARYTIPAQVTPTYDTQEALYQTLDTQLKEIVQVLSATPSVEQVALGANDIYYAGDVTKWIKAANSLRLKMAFRLMKRNPERLKAIATEVLSAAGGVISSTADDWKLVSGVGFTGGAGQSNYNPVSNGEVSGSKNMVDFMWRTSDPRTRVFYQPSPFTKERYEAALAQGKIPASMPWDGQLYRGQYADPDASGDPNKAIYFANISYSFGGATTPVQARLPSLVQSRLFYGAFENGNGLTTFPIITYADVCFMRAELAARGITGTDAEGWYYKGIDASLANYDDMAKTSGLNNYVALTSAEATAYKAKSGVVYDPTNALEQILVQQYINYFKNQNEAWAVIKRTGFPSATGKILQLEVIRQSGTPQAMPRRFTINLPTVTNINYQNIQNAIVEQQKEPGFGAPSDITGRVWWDKQ